MIARLTQTCQQPGWRRRRSALELAPMALPGRAPVPELSDLSSHWYHVALLDPIPDLRAETPGKRGHRIEHMLFEGDEVGIEAEPLPGGPDVGTSDIDALRRGRRQHGQGVLVRHV